MPQDPAARDSFEIGRLIREALAEAEDGEADRLVRVVSAIPPVEDPARFASLAAGTLRAVARHDHGGAACRAAIAIETAARSEGLTAPRIAPFHCAA